MPWTVVKAQSSTLSFHPFLSLIPCKIRHCLCVKKERDVDSITLSSKAQRPNSVQHASESSRMRLLNQFPSGSENEKNACRSVLLANSLQPGASQNNNIQNRAHTSSVSHPSNSVTACRRRKKIRKPSSRETTSLCVSYAALLSCNMHAQIMPGGLAGVEESQAALPNGLGGKLFVNGAAG